MPALECTPSAHVFVWECCCLDSHCPLPGCVGVVQLGHYSACMSCAIFSQLCKCSILVYTGSNTVFTYVSWAPTGPTNTVWELLGQVSD
jgi:hypothetical protein